MKEIDWSFVIDWNFVVVITATVLVVLGLSGCASDAIATNKFLIVKLDGTTEEVTYYNCEIVQVGSTSGARCYDAVGGDRVNLIEFAGVASIQNLGLAPTLTPDPRYQPTAAPTPQPELEEAKFNLGTFMLRIVIGFIIAVLVFGVALPQASRMRELDRDVHEAVYGNLWMKVYHRGGYKPTRIPYRFRTLREARAWVRLKPTEVNRDN